MYISTDMAGRKIIARYEKNTKGRDFVCGDIHGCYTDLEQALKRLRFDTARDRMFCVGDLFDRGPESHGALAYLDTDWFFPVQGNHEDMFLKWYIVHDLERSYSYRNGSGWQLKEDKEYLAQLARAVVALPLIIVVGENLIVHACLPDVSSLEEIEQDPDKYIQTILWYRGRYPDKIGIPGIRRVYCGHSITSKVRDRNGFINIDTGAFLHYMDEEGELTVVELGD
ncbi:MAG: metallophosphoesterase [Spirochaetales bacterium]|jgi:serine/threonine protein phosphatase 1|nr:metallophosphoesterase [Spirochaetales bacterium]